MAINLANKRLLDRMDGWRVVFFIGAALGIVTAVITALGISEPRHAARAERLASDAVGGASAALAAEHG